MRDHYEIVVVGSGYGGSVAASRMARAGRDVCLLERGREIRPGEYPRHRREVFRQIQADAPEGSVGRATGLFDFSVNEDVNVARGCGLGGTSLINANVWLEAEPRVFDESWPGPVREDRDGRMEEGYRRARAMLEPRRYPQGFPDLRKMATLEASAETLDEEFSRVPITVSFEEGPNRVGVPQHPCELCGDCCTGCNYGAKNTLLMNYLPDAWSHGAEIFTRIEVRWLSPEDGRWILAYQPLEYGREVHDGAELFVSADIVFLGAGSLGTSEILLRSREKGLPLSDQVGRRFSANGDFIEFGYNTDREIDGLGYGPHAPENREPVGPCITSIIDFREQDELEDGVIVEEGSVPGGLVPLLPLPLALAADFFGKDTDQGLWDWLRERWRILLSLVLGPYHGAPDNTQTYLMAGHDDGQGTMHLEDDRLRISWPGLGDQPGFARAHRLSQGATEAVGGTHIRNPTWGRHARTNITTAHPLGGCVMGESAEEGAVNARNQVFAGDTGQECYPDLYVTDASVIPRSVGINPFKTICALAERACSIAAEDRGWTVDYGFPPLRRPEGDPPTGLTLSETMYGHYSTRVAEDLPPEEDLERYFEGERLGREAGTRLSYVATMVSEDLQAFVDGRGSPPSLVGSVVAPDVSPEPLVVTGSSVEFFRGDVGAAGEQAIHYHMNLTAVEGRRFRLQGIKILAGGPWYRGPWSDTSLMYFTLREGSGAGGRVLGTGILRMTWTDFFRQLRTVTAQRAPTRFRRLAGELRFIAWFLGGFFDAYGLLALWPGFRRREPQ